MTGQEADNVCTLGPALIGLCGVIVGASITWIKDSITQCKTRNRAARYLAIRVVILLDRYVEDCSVVACDPGEEVPYDGKPGSELMTQPRESILPFPNWPADIDWKSIDDKLAYRLLSLHGDHEAATEAVNGAWEHAGPPDNAEVFRTQTETFGTLGVKAYDLTCELRRIYKLPSAQYRDWWDPVEKIKEAQRRLSQRRAIEAEFDL